MSRTDWKYLIDTLLFICVVGIAFIGFLMGLVIPKGSAAPESAKYFLGLHRHQWGNIHFYLSIAFVVLVIIHLILSWSWIKGKARQLFKRRWAVMLTLTAFVSFLVLFLFWAFFPKQTGTYEGYGVRAGRQVRTEAIQHEPSSVLIHGQMTLYDIERTTGVPAQKIAEKLRLPPGAPLDEQLGWLRKRYAFSMQEVRDAVASLMQRQ